MHQIKLITLPSAKELGKQINYHLNSLFSSQKKTNYVVNADFIRFSNGEGKCVIEGNITNCDIYIICDPSNYGVKYNFINFEHNMGPDEHVQDIKRAISAIAGHANRINVVMPLFYQSRQDKRKKAESLDCAMLLKELEWYGVKNIVTVDIHNQTVENAIPFNMGFYNESALDILLSEFKRTVKPNNLFVISPDSGATKKANYCAKKLNTHQIATFEKRRNYNLIDKGQNPIEYHEFTGPKTLSGHDVLLVDDMIASGNSLISSIHHLKKITANNIYLMTTFSLFTEGLQGFITAHKNGLFQSLFTTNLSYIPKTYEKNKFIHIVDCSQQIAQRIYTINQE